MTPYAQEARLKGRGVGATIVLAVILLWPMLPGVPPDALNTAILAALYLIGALSLVLLIGMVGQISLCQAALVGMGAFVGSIFTRKLGVHFPFTLAVGLAAGALTAAVIGVVALRVRGLYLAVATMIFAYVSDRYLFIQPWLVETQSGTSVGFEAVGQPSTFPYFDLGRSKVFYYVALAVAITSLYMVANLRDSRLGRAFSAIRGSEIAAASLGINVTRYKLLGFALAGALAGLGGGLTLTAQRTVAPGQFDFTNSLYFLTIAVVGGLRSLGGAVSAAALFALMVGEAFYRYPALADYRDLISGAMLLFVLLFFRGGLGALPGRIEILKDRMRPRVQRILERLRPLLSPISRVHVKPALEPGETGHPSSASGDSGVISRIRLPFFSRRLREDNGQGSGREPGPTSSLGTALLRRLPGRFGHTAAESSEREHLHVPIDVIGLTERLAPPVQEPIEKQKTQARVSEGEAGSKDIRALIKAASGAHAVAGEEGEEGRRTPVLLSANNITVRFGGLTAVDDASIKVGAGEIIGLIGPNGAGKTTLFNSILGLNQPTQGTVDLFGRDVTSWDVHKRAALGVGRTFQILQLFPELTVFENLLVATHLQNPTGVAGALFVSYGARRAELAASRRVHAVLRLMEMEHLSHQQVAGLPFGVLRLIEVARTLVAGARLVCFDEPASGLDSAETERLIEWFRLLRQIGITLLVIEHDVSMVVRLCDYIYVLDQGKLISQGTPSEIQSDPAVIASYLGAAAPAEVA